MRLFGRGTHSSEQPELMRQLRDLSSAIDRDEDRDSLNRRLDGVEQTLRRHENLGGYSDRQRRENAEMVAGLRRLFKG